MDNKKSKIKKKPKFKRQDSILKRLKNKWRKPKGIHSKLRLRKRGKGKRPRIGYGSDKKTRYLIKNKNPIYVTNIKQLENVKQPIIIASKVGLRKKLEIINKIKELKLEVLNIKDIDKFLEEAKKKKEDKEKKKKEKKEKKSKKLEKSKEEKKKQGTKEDKEKKEKEEKKKVLEKGL